MIIPDLKNFNNYPDFLEVFFNTNKKANPSFSYEYFARRIKWPKSALADAITGRRNLSMRRAIEFTNFTDMDALDTETFIFWALRNDCELPENVHKLFSHHEEDSKQIISDSPPSKRGEVGSHLFFVLHAFLLHTQELPSSQHILESLPFLTNMNVTDIENCINTMKENGIILQAEDGSCKIVNKTILIDIKGDPKHDPKPSVFEALNTTKNYYTKPRKSLYDRDYLYFAANRIKKSDYDEIKRKVADLMSWIRSFNTITEDENSNYEEYQLFQISSFLHPLTYQDYKKEEKF